MKRSQRHLLSRFRRMAGGGGGAWWIPGVAVQLDFAEQRYFWNGAVRQQSDFTAFSLSGTASLSSSGLVVSVAADLDVRIDWSALGLTAPFSIVVSATPSSTGVSQGWAAVDIDTSNYLLVGLNTTNRRALLVTANVTNADLLAAGAAVGVRDTIGVNFETNNILQSVNGAIGAAADITATLFSPNNLRIGERPGDTNPARATIHHVVLYAGAMTQTQLNDATAAVHALSIA